MAMTGLSIQQPWNELLVAGEKRIEVRRYPRDPVLPMPMAIHASLEFDRHAPVEICTAAARWGAGSRARRGAITGVATLVEIFKFTPTLWRYLIEGHRNPLAWYRDGLWGWRFVDAVRLAEPVRCRGFLGFWSVPSDVEARVRRMLADSGAQEATRAGDHQESTGPEEPGTGETLHSGEGDVKTGREDSL